LDVESIEDDCSDIESSSSTLLRGEEGDAKFITVEGLEGEPPPPPP
jgi:hypothetical protein